MGDAAATNVGAIIPGADSTFRDEYIVLSAHYDHLGRFGTDPHDPARTAIHPGADDNASGTAAILELARRFAERPARRSIVILAFGAEERGLVGSQVFVEHPSIELRRIVIALNLDMVGRLWDDRVTVYGVSTPFLRAMLDSTNVAPRLTLVHVPKSSGRSDDFSFAGRGIAALHFTTGEHESYHRTTDTVERIELDGLARVTDFVERVTRAAAGNAPR
jgi:Zn-dependent M28 family amino/carboxypeptidase